MSSELSAPMKPSNAERNLWTAVGVSLAIHALVLSLQFKFPDASRAFTDKALEIILVNSKSARKPSDVQARAQSNLDGGGNTDQNRRAKTPLPLSATQQDGSDLQEAQRRIRELEVQQQRLFAEANSKRKVSPRSEKEVQTDPSQKLSGRDLAQGALAMARLEGEIAKNIDDYNKRPRKKHIGARAEEYRFAQYVEDWRIKVERVGTLNYPEAAKGKLYGTLVLTVTIKSDGSVVSVEINRPSGHRILDEAARRIVQMASPYATFSAELKRDFDELVITRSWSFTASDRIETR